MDHHIEAATCRSWNSFARDVGTTKPRSFEQIVCKSTRDIFRLLYALSINCPVPLEYRYTHSVLVSLFQEFSYEHTFNEYYYFSTNISLFFFFEREKREREREK